MTSQLRSQGLSWGEEERPWERGVSLTCVVEEREGLRTRRCFTSHWLTNACMKKKNRKKRNKKTRNHSSSLVRECLAFTIDGPVHRVPNRIEPRTTETGPWARAIRSRSHSTAICALLHKVKLHVESDVRCWDRPPGWARRIGWCTARRKSRTTPRSTAGPSCRRERNKERCSVRPQAKI